MDITVKFLGATGTVTGSKFLVTAGKSRVLFDCGLFQGLKELRLRNWEDFPVDPSSIDAVVISHAHIDHTGYLPKLVREGFSGPVYCTHATADLMEILLLDSARLQEEEAAFALSRGYSRHPVPTPLYTTQDAERVFPLIRKCSHGQKEVIADNIAILFHDAGHLLGAAVTEMFFQGVRERKKLVFSGDLGRQNDALMKPPAKIEEADVLFIESTYGNRSNPHVDPRTILEKVVNETFAAGGVVVIPAFAVGRTQTLLYYFHQLMKEDRIPDVPVYIDSPMAVSATYLYYKHREQQRMKFDSPVFAPELETDMLVFVKNTKHSKSLNNITKDAIIISSSGMMTGGRILHHMYNRLPRPQDTFLVCGYQAAGTRGRDLVDGKKTIRMFGEDVPVRCRVENLTALSGHADREELFEWMKNFRKTPKMVFTVHGEGNDLKEYAASIRKTFGWNVVQPEYLETVSLFKGI